MGTRTHFCSYLASPIPCGLLRPLLSARSQFADIPSGHSDVQHCTHCLIYVAFALGFFTYMLESRQVKLRFAIHLHACQLSRRWKFCWWHHIRRASAHTCPANAARLSLEGTCACIQKTCVNMLVRMQIGCSYKQRSCAHIGSLLLLHTHF